LDDPYTLLGVARDASQEDIKRSYRKLARAQHPDLHPGDKQAEEKFKKTSAAYDLLSDPKRRARFDAGEIDASGAERGYRPGPGPSPRPGEGFGFGGNAEDIFAELLRRSGRGRRASSPFGDDDFQMKGADANYSLRVSFVEAAIGGTKRILLPTGKNLDVKVPPGTVDGTVLRLKGQGAAGLGGGPAGDALIEIKVDSHPLFVRDGNNVTLTVPVTLPEAVLGGKIDVPTLEGKVSLTVPAGSNTDDVLRLRGKGIPHGKSRGDLLVTLKVILPDKPDAELQAFLKKWADANPYDVRNTVTFA
jgi:DnaJ-class molecular chaperone